VSHIFIKKIFLDIAAALISYIEKIPKNKSQIANNIQIPTSKDRNVGLEFLDYKIYPGFSFETYKPFVRKPERSDIHKYSIFILQFSIPACPD